MIEKEKFDLNDIALCPAVQTEIVSRKEIRISHTDFDGEFKHLPLIAAPMDTVVSKGNINKFLDNGISVCLPRGEEVDISYNTKGKMVFISYSLVEFTKKFISRKCKNHHSYILIDMANGHMSDLVYVTKKAKEKYGNKMTLMVGNVANPETYKVLSEAGADFIRVSIGSGAGCLTSVQTAISYPIGSLIKECYEISKTLENPSKIVADGGMKNYSDIIKALALGSSYVMVGSIFNKSIESCGENYINNFLFKKKKISQEKAEKLYKKGKVVYKKFRGMSTKEVQKKWGNTTLKTSEGVVRYRPVEYTLQGWTDNFSDYLRSAMSYTNSKGLSEFIGKVKYNKITYQAYNRFNK